MLVLGINAYHTSRLVGSRVTTGIDFLRGLFALFVVVAHATGLVQKLHGPEALASTSGHLLSATLRQGLVWVMGFFVISGFCIQHSTATSLQTTGHFDWMRYALARISRIVPFYLFALALAILAESLHTPADISYPKLVASLTMTQGVFGCFSAFENSWSLTNEVFYYGVFGLLACSAKGRMKSLLRTGVAVSVGLTLLAIGAWLAMGKPGMGIFPFWSIPLQMLVWLSGVALFHYWKVLTKWCTPERGLWIFLPLSFGVVYFFYVRLWLDGVRLIQLELINLAWVPFFLLLILALPHVAMLDHPKVRTLSAKLGLLSYPLYLLHLPIQDMISSLLHPSPWFFHAPDLLQGIVHLVVPVVLCILFTIPLEEHLLSWRKRWLNQIRPTARA